MPLFQTADPNTIPRTTRSCVCPTQCPVKLNYPVRPRDQSIHRDDCVRMGRHESVSDLCNSRPTDSWLIVINPQRTIFGKKPRDRFRVAAAPGFGVVFGELGELWPTSGDRPVLRCR